MLPGLSIWCDLREDPKFSSLVGSSSAAAGDFSPSRASCYSNSSSSRNKVTRQSIDRHKADELDSRFLDAPAIEDDRKCFGNGALGTAMRAALSPPSLLVAISRAPSLVVDSP